MKIIKELRETRSNIEKCSILTRLTEIEKKVFYYAYNPFSYLVPALPEPTLKQVNSTDLVALILIQSLDLLYV